jgi:FkbM family methyltransferase
LIPLVADRLTYYSQDGEDRILVEIFADKKHGVCLEVGANDGITFSNSLAFEKLGWHCILVEPNPQLCELIERRRKAHLVRCAASDRNGTATLHFTEDRNLYATLERSASLLPRIDSDSARINRVEVPCRTLDDILEECGVDSLDFVSIDVEGHEMEVLKGFSVARWKPKLLLIEDNSLFADESVARYLGTSSYRRFKRTGCNDWYANKRDRAFVSWSNTLTFEWLRSSRKLACALPSSIVRVLRALRRLILGA